ncbi:NAD(P)/FAD-dependent oxidoreductase [Nocardioides mangrovicus]|uniref:NAD(P)/FAD-dependent oxidoreductase n=1 Tax=Nocardioides mangrovicus TaxID=2478913 RepID=A0A3L8P1W4_9ACTN|nr:NAD(P)/FAD-dependent oxidoreductase [Nocardioides mangrovicus]RLV48947.1 NAD(P)/FAD-dependent oxidoreductase [Nocardioides mangrovicus]
MARVAVVGGGYAGMACAARLAKLGHEVTVHEAADRLGGALGTLEHDGYRWDTGPAHTLLPAVVRDLFRKTGRALEQELARLDVPDLEPAPPRRHVLSDGSVVDLPEGRAESLHALDAAYGTGAGAAWLRYTDEFNDAWADLRRDWFEQPWSPDHASARARQLLTSRYPLAKLVRTALPDDRLRELALGWTVLEGQDAARMPAWTGVRSYLEQKFGTWTLPGGMGRLAEVLAGRLATRGVAVHLGTTVLDLVVREDRVAAVRTAAGDEPCEVAVVATDPRRLPVLAPLVSRSTPTLPPAVCHLGLTEDAGLPFETVLHGDPHLVVRASGAAVTILGRGRGTEDLVEALAARGTDLRGRIEVRVDRSPRDLAAQWNGSPYGVAWQDPRTLARRGRYRLGTTTPLTGVHAAGAHGPLGAGLHHVGLSAALVAQAVGAAD